MTSLQYQNYSNNIIPLVNIVKDKINSRSSKSILDTLENTIKSKSSNNFLINIPMNLKLSKKTLKPLKRKLKNPIEAFYKTINSNPNYQISILKRFSKLPNVIPVIDVSILSYTYGNIAKLRSQLNNLRVAYIFYSRRSNIILKELSSLITSNDILIYDLDTYDFNEKFIKNEITTINKLKKIKNFKSLVVKQIYNDLTFFKLNNDEITYVDPAYSCIDSNFIHNFSSYDFDYFGDYCGVRNIPIYVGGKTYPAYIGLHTKKFSHFGFIGKELDTTSYATTLLPNIKNSKYWNAILTASHKKGCFGCSKINDFLALSIPQGTRNPINNGTIWKSIIISHYLSIMDYKLKNSLI